MKVDNSTVEAFKNKLNEAGMAELSSELRFEEVMKPHTSFRVGGPAQVYAEPSDTKELAALLSAADSVGLPYFLMGNGSNIVVSDEGIDGLVIRLGEKFSEITSEEDPKDPSCVLIRAAAGTLLTKLSSYAAKAGLTGLEFASGIPGSLGGAVFMNAGAYDHDMSEVLEKVISISPSGEVTSWKKEDLKLGYRSSVFMIEGGIVAEAVQRR